MAAEGDGVRTFIFTGAENEAIPDDATPTHFRAHESVTRVPARLFWEHENSNIVKLSCHDGVTRIEERACFCRGTLGLGQLIIPGVRVVEREAFEYCRSLGYVECPKLERVGEEAFRYCESLSDINLPSAKIVVVEGLAFADCEALEYVQFGEHLEAINGAVFSGCVNLERITIPLKDGLFAADDVFQGCESLESVDLIEEEVLRETIEALHLDRWKYEMYRELDSINLSLPNAPAEGEVFLDFGQKARVIRWWIKGVLRKIIHFKAEHRRVLHEVSTALIEVSAALQVALPEAIVMNHVLFFLELPLHTFDGEVNEEDRNGDQ